AIIAGFYEYARVGDRVVREHIVDHCLAKSGRDIQRFLVRRKRDAIGKIARPVAVAAQQSYLAILDQIEAVVRKFPLTASAAAAQSVHAVRIKSTHPISPPRRSGR